MLPNLRNLKQIIDCVRKSGLKLSSAKFIFGTTKINFLGNILTPAGIHPESKKKDKFLSKMKMPQTVKQVKRLIGFVQFFRNHIPKLNEILILFYERLQKSALFSTSDRDQQALEQIRNALRKATTVVLKFPKPGLQYVILCDASYPGAGYVLLVEDYLKNDKHKEQKTYAPISFGSKLYNKSTA